MDVFTDPDKSASTNGFANPANDFASPDGDFTRADGDAGPTESDGHGTPRPRWMFSTYFHLIDDEPEARKLMDVLDPGASTFLET
jgi:hypothetical protein